METSEKIQEYIKASREWLSAAEKTVVGSSERCRKLFSTIFLSRMAVVAEGCKHLEGGARGSEGKRERDAGFGEFRE